LSTRTGRGGGNDGSAGRKTEWGAEGITPHESVLAEGQAALSAGFRWEDYFALAVDPSDGSTFWFGGLLQGRAGSLCTRIGARRLVGCAGNRN